MLRRIKFLIILAGLFAACGTSPDSESDVDSTTSSLTWFGNTVVTGPSTAVARALTWGPVYGQPSVVTPAVVWLKPNCYNGRGYMHSGLCVQGEFVAPNVIVLAMSGLTVGLTSVPFSHEMCHAAIYVKSGGTNADPDHTNGCFYAGGQAEAANAVLWAAGL